VQRRNGGIASPNWLNILYYDSIRLNKISNEEKRWGIFGLAQVLFCGFNELGLL